MNIYASPTDFARTDITCPTDFADDRAQVAMYASLTRVIEGAPVENKLAVFCLMARTAAADTALYRQQMVDDLWHLADDLGLVTLVGANNVQAAIAVAFDGGAR